MPERWCRHLGLGLGAWRVLAVAVNEVSWPGVNIRGCFYRKSTAKSGRATAIQKLQGVLGGFVSDEAVNLIVSDEAYDWQTKTVDIGQWRSGKLRGTREKGLTQFSSKHRTSRQDFSITKGRHDFVVRSEWQDVHQALDSHPGLLEDMLTLPASFLCLLRGGGYGGCGSKRRRR